MKNEQGKLREVRSGVCFLMQCSGVLQKDVECSNRIERVAVTRSGSKHIHVSRQQNAGQNRNIKVANRSF
jgi:hypothetical protein